MDKQQQHRQQFDMQMMAREKNERAAQLFEHRLNSEFFPEQKLSYSWRVLTHRALRHSAPMSHRIGLKEFASVVKCDPLEGKKITLFEFGVLSNALEAVSPDQLGLNSPEYVQLIEEATKHIEYYSDRIRTIRSECDIEAEKEMQMKRAAMEGKDKPILKTVKGQA